MQKLPHHIDRRSSKTALGSFTVREVEHNVPDDSSAFRKITYTVYPSQRNFVLNVLSEIKDVDKYVPESTHQNFFLTPRELTDWVKIKQADAAIRADPKVEASFELFSNQMLDKPQARKLGAKIAL